MEIRRHLPSLQNPYIPRRTAAADASGPETLVQNKGQFLRWQWKIPHKRSTLPQSVYSSIGSAGPVN